MVGTWEVHFIGAVGGEITGGGTIRSITVGAIGMTMVGGGRIPII